MTTSNQTEVSPKQTRGARHQSILVIDDCPDTLHIQRTLLEMQGYEVHTASSGEEAFEILGKIDEPNLILLDLILSDMSGTEFLSQLESTHPEIVEDVPVIFVTGMDSVPPSKAVGFIRKPADTATFLEVIQTYALPKNFRH